MGKVIKNLKMKVFANCTRVFQEELTYPSIREHLLWDKSHHLPSHISINICFSLGIPANLGFSSFHTAIYDGFAGNRYLGDENMTLHDLLKYGKTLHYQLRSEEKRYVTHIQYREDRHTDSFIEMTLDEFIQMLKQYIDRKALEIRSDCIREELVERTWHPHRLEWILPVCQSD
jgi:hypothetical protein